MNLPLAELAQWLQATDIATLELHGPGTSLRLVREADGTLAESPLPAAADTAPVDPAAPDTVRAGSAGVLCLAPPGRAAALVHVGQAVAAGQPLALLAIGLVLLPVLAPRAGTIARVLADDGATVGWGTPLFELA